MVIPGPTVSTLYNLVIDEVVNKSRNDFLALEGSDELLHEIRALWEKKLKRLGAVGGGGTFMPAAFVRPSDYDLNIPISGHEVYQAPPADMPSPMGIIMQDTAAASTVDHPSGITEDHALEDGEPPLDDADEDLQVGELPETNQLILAQFVKVTRRRNNWRCTFRSGIMHINGQDKPFKVAVGVFEH